MIGILDPALCGLQKLDGIRKLGHLFEVLVALVHLEQFVVGELKIVDGERLVALPDVVVRLPDEAAQHDPQINVLKRTHELRRTRLGQHARLVLAAAG